MEEIIEIWKAKNIERAIMDFVCGGDSIGDTSFSFETKDGEIIFDSFLEAYFQDNVYNNVEFYVNSDGHYIGEMGQVIIEFDEEEGEFSYMKDAQAEYNESIANRLEIQLTDAQAKFVQENVSNINGENWEGESHFNYKRDFIIDDETEELIDELRTLLEVEVSSFAPKVDGELLEDWSFETLGEDNLLTEDNKLIVEVTNRYTTYEDCN